MIDSFYWGIAACPLSNARRAVGHKLKSHNKIYSLDLSLPVYCWHDRFLQETLRNYLITESSQSSTLSPVK